MTSLASALLILAASLSAEPPFRGTIFIDRDIITEADPTAFVSLAEKGRGERRMFDRRENRFITVEAFLFEAFFDDCLTIEVQVNPEFQTAEAARAEVMRFIHATGQLPTVLRRDVQTMWIHKGKKLFGGGNHNLLIHMGQLDEYVRGGILEETLMHEAAHSSLDRDHAGSAGWRAAQKADPLFISNYAKDHPTREDIAETFVPYFAVQFRRERIPAEMAKTILEAIPNRIEYLDAQMFEMHPVISNVPPPSPAQ